jgi:hypothetical protein
VLARGVQEGEYERKMNERFGFGSAAMGYKQTLQRPAACGARRHPPPARRRREKESQRYQPGTLVFLLPSA